MRSDLRRWARALPARIAALAPRGRLFQAERRFRQLADAMPQIVWTADADGTIDYGNKTVLEYTGLSVESHGPRTWLGMLHPDDVAPTVALWAQSVASGQEFNTEYRLFHQADRSYRWHRVRAVPIRNDDGSIVKWYGTATDIHDSKLASDHLARIAQQLSSTLESIPEAFFTLDFDWRITFLNKEAERMMLRKREDLLGKVLWDEYPALLGTIAEESYRRARAEQRTVEFEMRYQPLERWFRVRIHPSPDGLTVFCADTTERRRLELIREEQTRILERMAAGAPLDEVMGGAARMIEAQTEGLRCLIALLDESGTGLRCAESPHLPQALLDAVVQVPAQLLLGGDGAQRPREGLHCWSLAGHPAWAAVRAQAGPLGLEGCWTYPVRSPAGDLFGALVVFSHVARPPQPFESDLIASCAHIASIALERQRSERQARAAADRLRLRERAIEASTNPILIRSATREQFPIEYANPAFERVTGYAASEVVGRRLDDVSGEQDFPGFEELRASWSQQREVHVLLRIFRPDGTPVWLDTYSSPVRDERGTVTHFVQAMYDVTAERQYQEELEYRSNHDLLTGLANRNLLRDRASQAIAQARARGEQVWIAFLNLDRFRVVNETLGPDAGDAVLQAAATRIRDSLGPLSTASRWGSDEYVLVLTDARDEHAAINTVNRIMANLAQPLAVQGTTYFPSSSAGLAVYPADGDAAEVLIRHAQMAMRMARQSGGSRLQFFTAAMNERAVDWLRLETDLRHALERNELVLHYQPQVELRNGRVVGMEALLRWNHPELGLLGPDRFIPVAEDSGLIVPIGAWVLRTACQAARQWRDGGFGDLCVAVNLSVVQFNQPDLVPSVRAVLADTGLDPASLDLELTEGLVMHDVERALGVMHELKALGVRLSMDDFGTGYSSLSHLKRFPIDVVKIDKSFVRNITTDPDEAAIAQSIISLSHSLQLHVIAEGVETEEQLGFLRRHRCDQIQGFYFSRPLPEAQFAQLLAEDRALPAATPDAPHQQTLLIVDNDANIRSALHRLLRREGYRILLAACAEEGLALLALHQVQVVVSDQRMPGMHGTEFLVRVKAMYPHTIRIMLTGYTAVESIIEATNSGAVFRFHTKPWDDEVIRNSIAEAFRYHWLVRGADDERPA